MKIAFIYRFFPVLVFYTNRLVKPNFSGITKWFILPYICIRPPFRGDKGMLIHELTHCKQMLKGLVIFYYIRRWLSREFVLRCEVEAYSAQGLTVGQIDMMLEKYK
jgi:hypothetical protein